MMRIKVHSIIDIIRLNAYNVCMNSREIMKILEKDGWKLDRTKGSHNVFKHPTKPGHVLVPHPKKDFPLGTLRSIFKQASIELLR